jgi:ribosomal protein L11 methylase PrmA
MAFLFLIIHILFILFFIFSILAFFTGAPFLPTPSKIVEEMMTVGKISEKDNVADLGSGDGRLIITAARKGAKGVGWEINPTLVLISILNTWRYGVGRQVKIRWGDYRRADLSKTTVVVLYSIAGIHTRQLAKKFKKEMAKGSRVISYRFVLPDLHLVKKTDSGIYIYSL